jgi:5'-deoxynucleotidase
MHNFFAMLSRMKLIERWSLMRSNRKENLMEHSAQVAILAQALAIIKNQKFNGNVDVDKVATIALYHDTGEVLSGDLPTPVKYFNSTITEAYHDIEKQISKKLLSMLPEEFVETYD